MRTRVKICGLTRTDDVRAAVRGGADAIGLVFHPGSPRHLTLEKAERLVAEVPAFVTVVGLFVDAKRSTIVEALGRVRLDLLQFHGGESVEDCRGFGRPWVKALRMRPGVDVGAALEPYGEAQGFLLDAYEDGQAGGTGRTFDWDLIPSGLATRIILAGGLNPQNVAHALSLVRPFAVDVSSGVESAPGQKSPEKIAAFLREVHDFDDRIHRLGDL